MRALNIAMRPGFIVTALLASCGVSPNATEPAKDLPMSETRAAKSATEVHVTRGDIQALLTGAGGTDMTPVEKDGKQIGMALVGADAGTTAARLGAATGDIIYSIGGHPLDSIGAAYRAGDLAARESRIEIRASRNGTPYTLLLIVDK